MKKPDPNEYNSYYEEYIALVPQGDIAEELKRQGKATQSLLQKITEQQGAFRYGEDKWCLKQVLGHMADTERIMAFRLLSIARGEKAMLPGFDENAYVDEADFHLLTMEELLANLSAVRESTIQLIRGLKEDVWEWRGFANQDPVSVRALVWIIVGHELHHRQVIQERYLNSNKFPSQ